MEKYVVNIVIFTSCCCCYYTSWLGLIQYLIWVNNPLDGSNPLKGRTWDAHKKIEGYYGTVSPQLTFY